MPDLQCQHEEQQCLELQSEVHVLKDQAIDANRVRCEAEKRMSALFESHMQKERGHNAQRFAEYEALLQASQAIIEHFEAEARKARQEADHFSQSIDSNPMSHEARGQTTARRCAGKR